MATPSKKSHTAHTAVKKDEKKTSSLAQSDEKKVQTVLAEKTESKTEARVEKVSESSSKNSAKANKALTFFLGTTAVVFVALWLILSTVVYVTAPSMVFDGYKRSQDSLTSIAAEPVFVGNKAGEKVSLRVVKGSTDSAVLYLPDVTGATGDMISQLFQYNNESKGTLIIASYPGYDASEGAPSFDNSLEAAELAYKYIVDAGVKEENIIIFGHGFGGIPATYLASQKSAAKKLVLVNTPASLQSACFRSFSIFCAFEGTRWNTSEYAKKVETPTYIFHTRTDKVVPFSEGEQLKKAFDDAKKAKSIQFNPIDGEQSTHAYFNVSTVLAN